MLHRFAAKSALAICATLACSGALTLTPRVVEAKPPAAAKAAKQPIGVGAIVGPQGPKVRAKVLKVLRAAGSYEVTDVEDVKPGSPPEVYQSMAQGTASDAIIVGTVSKAMNLTLSIYGANGARVDAVTVKGGSFPKLFKAIDNELEIALADPLERAHPGGAQPKAAVAPTPAPPPEKKKLAPGEEEDEEEADVEEMPGKGKAKPAPAAKPKAKAKADDEEDELESKDVDTTTGKAVDEEEESSESSDSASSEPSVRGLRPIELMVGIRGYNRKFAYTNPQPGYGLIPYGLPLAPTVMIAGRFYPLALSSDGALSNIGIQARYEYGIATNTNYEQAGATPGSKVVTQLKTHAMEYQIGIRGRLPLGLHELGVFALIGNHSFTLAGDESPTKVPYALVPDVHYHYVRVGLDARVYLNKLVVGAQLAPRFLTSMKELDKARIWFPGAKGSGIDFGLMLGWQFKHWLTPMVGLDVVRYGFDFNNTPANPPPRVLAGGATDTFLSGWIGASTNLEFGASASDGSASVSTESTDEDEDSKKAKSDDDDDDDEAPKKAAPKKAAPKKAAPPPKAKPPAKKPAKKPADDDEEEEEDEE